MADDVGAQGVAAASVSGRRYAAFISYSHRDEEFGDWLHKRLESYQVPSPLVGRATSGGVIGKRIGKVFRDRADLSAAHDLGREIREGLENSDALIVLCSPRSCGSKYVHEEIRTFKELGKGQRIFAAIIDGEPHAAGRPGYSAADECFPPSLIYALGRDGQISSQLEATEPIAADFRDGKDGRENGSLKIIAGLLDVGLDELVQREKQAERRRRLRANAIAAAMGVLALGAMGAGGAAWFAQQQAEQNAAEATRQEGIARRETGRANASAEDARRSADLATQRETEARNTLHRFFAASAWEKLQSGDVQAAARYALVGMEVAPANAEEYRTVLGAIMHAAGDVQPPLLHDGPVNFVAFSPNSQQLVTINGVGQVAAEARLWTADGRLLYRFRSSEDEAEPLRAAFSPSGDVVVVTGISAVPGGGDSALVARPDNVLIWDTRTGARVANWSADSDVVFSPDGRLVVSATTRTASADIRDGHTFASLAYKTDQRYESFVFSPNSRLLAGTRAYGGITIWDATTFEELAVLDTGSAGAWQFSQDSATLLSIDDAGAGHTWSMTTFQEGPPLRRETVDNIDELLGIGGATDIHDFVLSWVEYEDGDPEYTLVKLTGGARATMSSDGSRLATLRTGGIIWMPSARGGQTLRASHSLSTMPALSPDGQRVAAGDSDGSARVWRVHDNTPNAPIAPGLRDRNWRSTAYGGLQARFRAVAGWPDAPGDLEVRSASSGRILAVLDNVTRGWVFTPDGARLVLPTARWENDRRVDPIEMSVWDVRRLSQTWPVLSHDACVNLLSLRGRVFLTDEVDGDPLLKSVWAPDRDVCANVRNVPSLATLRRRDQVPAPRPAAATARQR